MDTATNLDPTSFNRLDLATFVLLLRYLTLALNYSGPAGSFATADSKGER